MTVVSNTSPLLNLALIDRVHLIEAQFGEVVIPTAVWNELTEIRGESLALRGHGEREALAATEKLRFSRTEMKPTNSIQPPTMA